jgi:predicted amidohydrolase YtcJ
MTADLIFFNGRVFTADPRVPFASAVALTGDRIGAVGEDSDALDLRGAATEAVDLRGRLLAPGFIDAHVHPASSGLDKLRLNFDDAHDRGTALEVIARYAVANPHLPWLVGSGWSQSWFPRGCPDKEILDLIVPDRPVLVTNTDGHGAWANSLALAIAGVDRDTSDPVDGRIERNPERWPPGDPS